MALLTYEYRLYPRRGEQQRLALMLEQSREVYNAALAECKAFYPANGKSMKAIAQWSSFREWRKQAGILLNASSLQQLLRRFDKSYGVFFRRVKAGEKPGHPRFKGHERFKSLEYTYGDGCKFTPTIGTTATLYVQNVGNLKVKLHRPLPAGAIVKHVMLKRKASGWYAYLMLDVSEPERVVSEHPLVGGDVGLLRLLTLSDGTEIDNPRWLRHSLKKLRTAQRTLSRRRKGSHRRHTARQQVALLHEHVANTRQDFWHKTTRKLVKTYRAIARENLSPRFMLANRRLALSAADAGFGMFQQLLTSKAENAGCELLWVRAAYTSQVCSGCGCIVEKALSVRVHACPHCALVVDRDVNAARNIYSLAFTSAWTVPSGDNVAPLAVPSGAGKRKRSLRSIRL